MRLRGTLAALALGAAVLLFVVAGRRRSDATAGAANPVPPVSTVSTANALRAPVPRFNSSQGRASEGELPPEVQGRLDGARAGLRAAARPCFVDRARDGDPFRRDETVQELVFRYTLRAEQGRDFAAELLVERSSVADPVLQSCLVAALSGARWPARGSGGSLRVAEVLRLGDLLAPTLVVGESR